MSTMRTAKPAEHNLEITALQSDGLGISELNERPVMVRNALAGEMVQARIVKKRRGIRFADAVAVERDHADRVAPPCPNFPRCGGCAMQHLSAEAQLRLKQRSLQDALSEFNVPVDAWVSPVSAARIGYRRKARLGVRRVGGQVLVGFRESFSNRVARMDSCEVLTPRLAALIGPLKVVIEAVSQPDKIPQIELAQGDREASIMVRHLYPLTPEDVRLWQQFADAHDVQVLLQSAGYDSLASVDGKPIRYLNYQITEYGIAMDFHPAHFTQVNAEMNRELVRSALAYLGALGGQRVADLFCGIGNFSLPLARAGALVEGCELSAEAVDQASRNAQQNGLDQRCRFEVADLYAEAGALTLAVDALILDPPRSGAGPNLSSWVASPQCQQVVYVSCNPKTFAQDAKVLTAAGFRCREVGVYDMFPQTAHVETIGHFVRG